MRVRGRLEDPLAIELPAGDPVPADQWEVWEAQSRTRLDLLNRLPLPWDVQLTMNVRTDGDTPDAGAR